MDKVCIRLFAVGPVIGGEYAFARRFTLGADLSLLYRTYSEDQDDAFDDFLYDVERDPSLINTETSVYVRLFL